MLLIINVRNWFLAPLFPVSKYNIVSLIMKSNKSFLKVNINFVTFYYFIKSFVYKKDHYFYQKNFLLSNRIYCSSCSIKCDDFITKYLRYYLHFKLRILKIILFIIFVYLSYVAHSIKYNLFEINNFFLFPICIFQIFYFYSRPITLAN